MLKIAICDDEKVFRDNINKYVAAYLNEKEISYEIDTFSSGKEIIDLGIEIKQYNIIFWILIWMMLMELLRHKKSENIVLKYILYL